MNLQQSQQLTLHCCPMNPQQRFHWNPWAVSLYKIKIKIVFSLRAMVVLENHVFYGVGVVED